MLQENSDSESQSMVDT